jgi:hypothetical protein
MMNIEQCLIQEKSLPLNFGWLAGSFQSKVLIEIPESCNLRETTAIVNHLHPSQ